MNNLIEINHILIVDLTEICLVSKLEASASDEAIGLGGQYIKIILKSGKKHLLTFNDKVLFENTYKELKAKLLDL